MKTRNVCDPQEAGWVPARTPPRSCDYTLGEAREPLQVLKLPIPTIGTAQQTLPLAALLALIWQGFTLVKEQNQLLVTFNKTIFRKLNPLLPSQLQALLSKGSSGCR